MEKRTERPSGLVERGGEKAASQTRDEMVPRHGWTLGAVESVHGEIGEKAEGRRRHKGVSIG